MSLPALVSGGDLNFQSISPTQGSANQPFPPTIAAATTIAPTTYLTKVSGTTNIGTITPPLSGSHQLMLVFTNGSPGQILTTGNVLVGTTNIVQNVPVILQYDPSQAKYYVGNLKS